MKKGDRGPAGPDPATAACLRFGWTTVAVFLLGGLLVPAGFLLGGVGNAEGDPSIAILLVPIGAVLVLVAVAGLAAGRFRAEEP